MRISHILLQTLALFLVTASPGAMAARASSNLKDCATTSVTMEGPCSSGLCAGFCGAKFQGSGTCFPEGCKCSLCRDIPQETKTKDCATTSVMMEGPCSTSLCAGFCEAKFQGSGTCFPRGCKCSLCRDIPQETRI